MKHRFSILGLLTLLLLTGGSLIAQPDAEEACVLTLDPATVEAGGSADLTVDISRWIGTVERVEIDSESGAQVLENALDETSGYKVMLDLEAAKAGDWQVVFHGERGLCTGTLNIRASA